MEKGDRVFWLNKLREDLKSKAIVSPFAKDYVEVLTDVIDRELEEDKHTMSNIEVNGHKLDDWHSSYEKPWIDNSITTDMGYTSNPLAMLYEKNGCIHVCEGRYSDEYCCFYNTLTHEKITVLAWMELPNKCIT